MCCYSLNQTFESYGCDGKMQDVAELVKWLISIGAKVETIGVYPLHAVIRLCIKASKLHPLLKSSVIFREVTGVFLFCFCLF